MVVEAGLFKWNPINPSILPLSIVDGCVQGLNRRIAVDIHIRMDNQDNLLPLSPVAGLLESGSAESTTINLLKLLELVTVR